MSTISTIPAEQFLHQKHDKDFFKKNEVSFQVGPQKTVLIQIQPRKGSSLASSQKNVGEAVVQSLQHLSEVAKKELSALQKQMTTERNPQVSQKIDIVLENIALLNGFLKENNLQPTILVSSADPSQFKVTQEAKFYKGTPVKAIAPDTASETARILFNADRTTLTLRDTLQKPLSFSQKKRAVEAQCTAYIHQFKKTLPTLPKYQAKEHQFITVKLKELEDFSGNISQVKSPRELQKACSISEALAEECNKLLPAGDLTFTMIDSQGKLQQLSTIETVEDSLKLANRSIHDLKTALHEEAKHSPKVEAAIKNLEKTTLKEIEKEIRIQEGLMKAKDIDYDKMIETQNKLLSSLLKLTKETKSILSSIPDSETDTVEEVRITLASAAYAGLTLLNSKDPAALSKQPLTLIRDKIAAAESAIEEGDLEALFNLPEYNEEIKPAAREEEKKASGGILNWIKTNPGKAALLAGSAVALGLTLYYGSSYIFGKSEVKEAVSKMNETHPDIVQSAGSALKKLSGDYGQSSHDALMNQATINDDGLDSFLKYWEKEWTTAGYEPPPIRLPQSNGGEAFYVDFSKLKKFAEVNPGSSLESMKDISSFKLGATVLEKTANALEAASGALEKLSGDFGQSSHDALMNTATIKNEGWGSFLTFWEKEWQSSGYQTPPIRIPGMNGQEPIFLDYEKLKAHFTANPHSNLDLSGDLSKFTYSAESLGQTGSMLSQVQLGSGVLGQAATAATASTLNNFGQSSSDALLNTATIKDEGWGSFLTFWKKEWGVSGYNEPPPIRLPSAPGEEPLFLDYTKLQEHFTAHPDSELDVNGDLSAFAYSLPAAEQVGQLTAEAAGSGIISQIGSISSSVAGHVSSSLKMAGMAALAVGVASAIAPTAIAAVGATAIGSTVLSGIAGAGAIAQTASQATLAYNVVSTAGSAIAGFFGWGKSSAWSWK